MARLSLTTEPQISDLSRNRAIDAYRWMSMNPERRADRDLQDYVAQVLDFAEALAPHALTDNQRTKAAEEVEAFRLKLIEWTNVLWAAKSRTASPMITGPACFPVAKNNKAMDAEHKKVGLYLEWLPKAKARAIKSVALVGAPEAPKNDTPAEIITIDGVDVVKNFELDRVQILFGGKPDSETIARLKGAGWNWSPRNSAWQRKLTPNALYSARFCILGSHAVAADA